MKSVVICASRRFQKEVFYFGSELEKLGVRVYLPLLKNWPKTEWEALTEEVQRLSMSGLLWEHFQKIEKADMVFIFNKDGYMGNSVTLELGYAAALHKPVIAMEKDIEIQRDLLVEGYVSTPQELAGRLGG